MRSRRWTVEQLQSAVKKSKSIRQVLKLLDLVPAGGNYVQIQHAIITNHFSTDHFTGMGWRRGSHEPIVASVPLLTILVRGSTYQSYKLKKRLFAIGFKKPICELCGWNERAPDGRLPLELDHINGDRMDNRLVNLRILCPNCHSLQSTHRGLNQKRKKTR